MHMKITRLSHAYRFPGFRPLVAITEIEEEPKAVKVTLKRIRQKKDQNVPTATRERPVGMITSQSWSEISHAAICACISSLTYGGYTAGTVAW